MGTHTDAWRKEEEALQSHMLNPWRASNSAESASSSLASGLQTGQVTAGYNGYDLNRWAVSGPENYLHIDFHPSIIYSLSYAGMQGKLLIDNTNVKQP